jgi:hypothetical protein
MHSNRLLINNSKTEFIIIGSKQQMSKININEITVGESTIEPVEVVQCIVMTIDSIVMTIVLIVVNIILIVMTIILIVMTIVLIAVTIVLIVMTIVLIVMLLEGRYIVPRSLRSLMP